MRSSWFGGIALLALAVSGCSTSGQSSSTTARVHTTTTLATSSGTPGPKDKAACAEFSAYQAALAAGKKPTSAAARHGLSRAENPKLRREVTYWEHALVAKDAAKVGHAQHTIVAICNKIGKSTTSGSTP